MRVCVCVLFQFVFKQMIPNKSWQFKKNFSTSAIKIELLWLIDFNGISTHLSLFYAKRLENMYIVCLYLHILAYLF